MSSYSTEVIDNIRLHGYVNAELTKRGKDPAHKVAIDHDNTVYAWFEGKATKYVVGKIEYVSGLGEIFEYSYT
jgi:hypothetical protein